MTLYVSCKMWALVFFLLNFWSCKFHHVVNHGSFIYRVRHWQCKLFCLCSCDFCVMTQWVQNVVCQPIFGHVVVAVIALRLTWVLSFLRIAAVAFRIPHSDFWLLIVCIFGFGLFFEIQLALKLVVVFILFFCSLHLLSC